VTRSRRTAPRPVPEGPSRWLGSPGPFHPVRIPKDPPDQVGSRRPRPVRPVFPSWGCLAPSTLSTAGSASPGFASPGTFRPRSFSLPRRFTPRTPCFSRGKPRDPLPLLGFRAGAVATRPARRRVLPHSAFRPRLAVPSASHPPALRNRRSRALDTTRPVEPYFRRKRPKACAPVGSFQPASIQGGRADSGARTEVCASPFRSVPVATRPKPRGSVDCFRTPSPA